MNKNFVKIWSINLIRDREGANQYFVPGARDARTKTGWTREFNTFLPGVILIHFIVEEGSTMNKRTRSTFFFQSFVNFQCCSFLEKKILWFHSFYFPILGYSPV